MKNHALQYKQYINDKKKISFLDVKRGNFYLIKEYINIHKERIKYTESEAPIIFALFVSKIKDELHAIKVSDISINKVKRLFENLYNDTSGEIEIKGSSKKIYNSKLSKTPTITNDTYRTYKLSGIKSIMKLDIDEDALIPKNKLKK
jgi:hypothetical protein